MEVERLLAEIDRKIHKIKTEKKSGKKNCTRCGKKFKPLRNHEILCKRCQSLANYNDLDDNYSTI